MSTHNLQFHDKRRKKKTKIFLNYRRISQGLKNDFELAIGVRAFEVLLYIV